MRFEFQVPRNMMRSNDLVAKWHTRNEKNRFLFLQHKTGGLSRKRSQDFCSVFRTGEKTSDIFPHKTQSSMTYRFQGPASHTEDVDESVELQQQQVGRNLNALIRKKSSEWKVLDEAGNCFISTSGLNFQLNLSTVDVRLEMCQALSFHNLESIEFVSFIREDISIFNYISWADNRWEKAELHDNVK